LAFTGFAITRKPAVDCIPLIAFGKVHVVADRYQMPFYVNFHHALGKGCTPPGISNSWKKKQKRLPPVSDKRLDVTVSE